MGHRTYINQNTGIIWLLYGRYDSVLAQIRPIGNYDGCGPEPQYCEKYDGFYMYMKLLEQLAQGCADGAFKDLLKN